MAMSLTEFVRSFQFIDYKDTCPCCGATINRIMSADDEAEEVHFQHRQDPENCSGLDNRTVGRIRRGNVPMKVTVTKPHSSVDRAYT